MLLYIFDVVGRVRGPCCRKWSRLMLWDVFGAYVVGRVRGRCCGTCSGPGFLDDVCKFSIRLEKMAHVIKVNRFRRGQGVGRRARGHQLETQFVVKNIGFMQGDPYLPQYSQNIMVVGLLCFIRKSLSFIYQSLSKPTFDASNTDVHYRPTFGRTETREITCL